MFDDPKVTINENTCRQLYLNQLQKDVQIKHGFLQNNKHRMVNTQK